MLKIEKYTVALITAAVGIGVVLPASAEEEALPAPARDTISRQTVSRQQIEADAEQKVREANASYSKGQYQDAINQYLEAVKILRSFDTEVFAKRIEACRAQIAKCYYYMAQDAVVLAQERAQAQDFEEAIRLCKQAIEYCPESESSIRAKIVEFEKRRAAAAVRADTSTEQLLPDKLGQDYRIQVLMRQGQELAQAGQLQRAVRKYQDILMIDPYNAEALHNLRAVNMRSSDVADSRYMIQHRKQMTELEWRWATPLLPEGETPVDNVVESPFKKSDAVTGGIDKKIRSIIIPRIDFEEVTIPTAIKFLQEESKRNDPEQVGVNIFLRRSTGLEEQQQQLQAGMTPDGMMMDPAMGPGPMPDQMAAPMPADPNNMAMDPNSDFSDGTEGGAELDPEANEKKISLIITKKSLFDALRYLCNAAGLKMRVEPYAVVVAPEHIALDDLETKIFPVERSAFGDLDVESSADPSPLKTFFIDRGIRFPQGAKIVYDTRISRLIVTNTIENLRLIDEVIQGILSDKDPMVEISAKFIEVSQNDLKELGFDYTVSYNPSNLPYGEYNASNQAIPGYSSHRLSFQESGTGLMRNYGSNELFVLQGFAGGADGAAYSARIFAANKMDSSDTLASPRITTLAGRAAHIEMVREVPFVEEYDEGEMQQGNSSSGDTNSSYQTYTTIGPFPDFEDPTPLGIMMDVTPEVDKARRTIRLQMAPKVTSFLGWTEFTSTDASGNIDLMRKPILAIREIDTTITIYDGETIVLGGVIDDSSTVLHDKVPILGDLPLVGRLFQSRYTSAEKKNLLIFMTCKLVKPDGTPFYPAERIERGLPQMGRLD